MKIKFTIPGVCVGYKTTTKRSKFTDDYVRYTDYQKEVRAHALMNGIRLPLMARKNRPLMIRTVA